jgi:hypothetical protein
MTLPIILLPPRKMPSKCDVGNDIPGGGAA